MPHRTWLPNCSGIRSSSPRFVLWLDRLSDQLFEAWGATAETRDGVSAEVADLIRTNHRETLERFVAELRARGVYVPPPPGAGA